MPLRREDTGMKIMRPALAEVAGHVAKWIVIREEVTACRECRYIQHMGSHFLSRGSETPQKIEIPDPSTIPSWCPLPDAGESLPPQAVRQTATAIMERAEKERLQDAPEPEPTYPCQKCGAMRTKAEGGTTFTVCDACWTATSTPVEKRCGTCKWWLRREWRLSGDCMFPVLTPNATRDLREDRCVTFESNANCPTWEAKL